MWQYFHKNEEAILHMCWVVHTKCNTRNSAQMNKETCIKENPIWINLDRQKQPWNLCL